MCIEEALRYVKAQGHDDGEVDASGSLLESGFGARQFRDHPGRQRPFLGLAFHELFDCIQLVHPVCSFEKAVRQMEECLQLDLVLMIQGPRQSLEDALCVEFLVFRHDSIEY